VARAQQGDRMRRIGVLVPYDENDSEGKRRVFAFTQALAGLGWTDGRNVRIDVRLVAGNADRMQVFAKELVGLQPDIILASSTPATVALQRETRTIPDRCDWRQATYARTKSATAVSRRSKSPFLFLVGAWSVSFCYGWFVSNSTTPSSDLSSRPLHGGRSTASNMSPFLKVRSSPSVTLIIIVPSRTLTNRLGPT
jgi:hypothetical protein